MKKMSRMPLFWVGLVLCLPANAVYNANLTGRVLFVATYSDVDYIYFSLDSQPAGLPCTAGYFAVPAAVPQNSRNQMFAQLLAAKESGASINVGYDSTGGCVDGDVQVHRIG